MQVDNDDTKDWMGIVDASFEVPRIKDFSTSNFYVQLQP
jgi:hypothetical protein